jgi:hypothetical protein
VCQMMTAYKTAQLLNCYLFADTKLNFFRLTRTVDCSLCRDQGDQIGRIFRLLGEFFLWAVYKKYVKSPKLWDVFIHGKKLRINLDKV